MKVREFWIDPDISEDLIEGELPVFMALPEKPIQGPLQWQASLIHVIEKSAYEEMKRQRDIYAQCMALALKEGIFVNKESVKRRIESALKELGEGV